MSKDKQILLVILSLVFLILFLIIFGFWYGITDNRVKNNPIYKQYNSLKMINTDIIQPTKNGLTVKNQPEDNQKEQEDSSTNTTNKISAISNDGYLGKFRVTRYCPCEICNGKWAANNKIDENGNIIAYGASGKILNNGYSCAADTSLPFGTKLYIPQIGLTVTVDDRAAKSIEQRYNGKFVDLYFTDHAHYIEGASDWMEVYIVE